MDATQVYTKARYITLYLYNIQYVQRRKNYSKIPNDLKDFYETRRNPIAAYMSY